MRSIFLASICLLFAACSEVTNQAVIAPQENKVENDFFIGEVRPEKSKPCFKGAYYRKLVSSHDKWVGISGKVVLPTIDFDPGRINPNKPQQYLDNPSIYLGGNMGNQETDIGLAWEIIKDENGVISADRKAYRPFLRRTGHISGQLAIFENGPATKDYYWYPGEEVFMSIVVISDKKIRFVIEGAGKKFERDFDCDGYSLNAIGEFKRVNAIDQVANEGKPVQATSTKIKNAVWKYTNLHRYENGKIVETPFHNERYTEMNCPEPGYFSVAADKYEKSRGAEIINISGSKF
ncbi:hypothetical protein Pedsa_0014 [Pseudopedobacter saltans DSM 12145]|uniref:Lipoprotein n=1 Tax=Pseudopedobacter saltans (strain ATCC 51119 / DSM 12145 / JCM 21818 / CCUG 39354 / LMG 10337 / NBRC 100064 / NCIMB 13643) TaxID=762903 RepID=F0SC18_PSESL|nr:hypothetical protein [Pseudopedobacter saltans]ADY50603.1 hypothetical protein Pedsa_0014 [Pseudopedobacter saltans DSM 12145]